MEWRILKFHTSGFELNDGIKLQNSASVYMTGNFFLFGGSLKNTSSTNLTFHFDKDAYRLHGMTSIVSGKLLPPPRERHTITQTGKEAAILFGGYNQEKKSRYNDVWLFTPFGKKHWKQYKVVGKVIPTARYAHTMTNISEGRKSRSDMQLDTCLLFGGYDGNYVDDVWQCELGPSDGTVSWKKIDTFSGPSARGYHASCFSENGLYVYGGRDSTQVFGDLWLFDLSQNVWKELRPNGIVPPPVYGHGFVQMSHYLFLIGGCSSNFSFPTEIWAFNLKSHTWYQINGNYKDFEGGLVGNQCISIFDTYYKRDRILIFGGVSFSNKNSAKTRADLVVYSLTSPIKPIEFKSFDGMNKGYVIKYLNSEKVYYNLYLAQNQTRLYAIKLVKNYEQFSSKILHIWKQFDHPNIIRLEATGLHRTQDGDNCGILVTPYYSQGNISKLPILVESCVLVLIAQLTSAIATIHAQMIPHGNLKHSSILISGREKDLFHVLKVTNIGLAADPCFASMMEFDPNQTFHADCKNLATLIYYLFTKEVIVDPKLFEGSYLVFDPFQGKKINVKSFKNAPFYIKWINTLLDPDCDIQALNNEIQKLAGKTNRRQRWQKIPADCNFHFNTSRSSVKVVRKSVTNQMLVLQPRESFGCPPRDALSFGSVEDWLRYAHLEEYTSVFQEKHITSLECLVGLKNEDLGNIISKAGHRKSFCKHVEVLKVKQNK